MGAAKPGGVTVERIWTAALLVIGDEILSGRTQDRNVAQVALWLNLQGIRLAEVRVVPDVTAAIVEAVAGGDVTPEEGAAVAAVVETHRRAIETEDLERRLAALEAKGDAI